MIQKNGRIMHRVPSLFSLWCAWFAYALLAPIIIISWYILLTFNPYDSYWFYDSSLHVHSLMHPVNLVGLLVYSFGAGALIVMLALTHGIFRLSHPEPSSLRFIDYSAGYLFLLISLSGLCALFMYDPLSAGFYGGLFGQQLHGLLLSVASDAVELVALQVVMFWGCCMTFGFFWAHYAVMVVKPFMYPCIIAAQAMKLLARRIRGAASPVVDPVLQSFSASESAAHDDLEATVYEITRDTPSTRELQ